MPPPGSKVKFGPLLLGVPVPEAMYAFSVDDASIAGGRKVQNAFLVDKFDVHLAKAQQPNRATMDTLVVLTWHFPSTTCNTVARLVGNFVDLSPAHGRHREGDFLWQWQGQPRSGAS